VSRRGIAFVISGPSGVGKSSILREALHRDQGLRFSVSHTTRAPRQGEVHGRDYYFVDESEFRSLVAGDAFLEHAEYQGHYYGTSRTSVEEPTSRGVDLILEVEVQGAAQLRERLPGAVSIFILPPSSMEQLEARLRRRGSDGEEVIRRRLEIARQEILHAKDYHYIVVNDELPSAVNDLLDIVRGARLEDLARSARLEGRTVLPEWRARFEAE
jgi:guanylate kinase